MEAREMWELFSSKNKIEDAEYEAWAFGDAPDELAELVVQGVKTGTTKTYVVPFYEVSKEHAYKEGEGDRSLSYWRKVHEKFFTNCLSEAGMSFDETMKVVCEEFEVVCK